MPETIDFPGRFYVHGFRYPETNGRPPLVEVATTTEIEVPYRRGHGRVFRVLGRWALVVGRWHQREKAVRSDDEADDVLMEALEGDVLPYSIDEIADW